MAEQACTPVRRVSSLRTPLRRGKRLRSQAKKIVENVRLYFEDASQKGRISANTVDRTALATGVSKSTVKRVRQERVSLGDEGEFSTPTKRYCRDRRRVEPDDFDREAIRRYIYGLYDRKINITLKKLLVSG